MEYLQYLIIILCQQLDTKGFKPYYKWNTFNTMRIQQFIFGNVSVLNLIINGIPSIRFSNNSYKES